MARKIFNALIYALLPVFGGFAIYLSEFTNSGAKIYLNLVYMASFSYLNTTGFWITLIQFVLALLVQRNTAKN